MRSSLVGTLVAVALALGVTQAAQARTIQLANTGTVAPPSCPANPCVVVPRTTAIQVKDGSDLGPFVVKQTGKIVGWTLTLGAPSANQIHYFDTHEGGTAQAALGVLSEVRGVRYALVEETPLVHVQPWFGKTATLRLSHPMSVLPGEVLALVVPTWAPALALSYPATTSWRASRPPSECNAVTLETAQDVVGSRANYSCLYQTALVTYAATEQTG